MAWHGYFQIENLNLDTATKTELVDSLRRFGISNTGNAAHRRNHWRTRLDDQAVIFEAEFNENNLTVTSFRNLLGLLFLVPPGQVSTNTIIGTYGPETTYTHQSTDYLRVIIFADVGSSIDESRAQAQAFLGANAAAWGDASL